MGLKNTLEVATDSRIVKCKIGTEKLDFLVYSGSTVNTIKIYAWDILRKNCRTVIHNIAMHPKEVPRKNTSQANNKVQHIKSF